MSRIVRLLQLLSITVAISVGQLHTCRYAHAHHGKMFTVTGKGESLLNFVSTLSESVLYCDLVN